MHIRHVTLSPAVARYALVLAIGTAVYAIVAALSSIGFSAAGVAGVAVGALVGSVRHHRRHP